MVANQTDEINKNPKSTILWKKNEVTDKSDRESIVINKNNEKDKKSQNAKADKRKLDKGNKRRNLLRREGIVELFKKTFDKNLKISETLPKKKGECEGKVNLLIGTDYKKKAEVQEQKSTEKVKNWVLNADKTTAT